VLYVGPPSENELIDILNVQSRTMSISKRVDMVEFASRCLARGLTGADTQALLYNAQLESIHRSGITYAAVSNSSNNKNDKPNVC